MNTWQQLLRSRATGFLVLLVVLSWCRAACASPPYQYYILSPEPLSGVLSVMSLEPNNTITVDGVAQFTLQQYDTATIPAGAFTSGSVISGSGSYTLGSNQPAANLPVPSDFAGRSFVVPQIAGSHSYFFLSPSGTATVTFSVGANVYTTTVQPGVVNEYDSGTDNTVAARITSDVPIVVAHTANLNGAPLQAFPVPPATTDLWGIRSQYAVVAALQDATSITAYASDGTTANYLLNAGQQVTVTAGSGSTQGQGSALYVTANAPVAAVQYSDGDSNNAAGFWPATAFGRRFGIPVNAQYVAIACNQPNVTISLYKGTNAPETQICSGTSTTPGKAYFGSASSGANVSAGWYLISSAPVYTMYKASSTKDEHNNLGLTPPAGPAAPVLASIASPTSNNPQTVAGTAAANQTVRLYVNGKLQATTTASGGGSFSFNAVLLDGSNTFYATAVSGSTESDPSNAITVQYVNNIPRSQSGTISGTVVWTPGSPAQAYTVTAADLVVASGAQLILQPGTQIQFGSGRSLTVNGTLTVKGAAGSPVSFTSSAASPGRGAWTGIVLNGSATGSAISNALVEWATTGVDVNGATAVTVANSTIRNFSSNGIYVRNGGNATISSNLITNVSGATGTGVYIYGTSPTLTGNTVTYCYYGVFLYGAANPSIQGNTLTSDSFGMYVQGASSATAQPNPVVNGNNIYSNTNWNLYTTGYVNGATTKLNFQRNWWGWAAPATIGYWIYDYTDSQGGGYPVVDYSSYLNGLNGQPTAGNYLVGSVSSSTTLTGGTTYDVLGTMTVPTGQTLTVPAGVTLRFYEANAQLLVNGTLNVQGTVASPVTLTSGNASPARGAWVGIVLNGSGANSSTINYAVVQWITTGVDVNGATGVTVSNNTIRNFSSNGVYVRNGGNATIASNLITNVSGATGAGIYVYATSPTISGNTISYCYYGVLLYGAANSALQGNTLTSNSYGMYVQGAGSATTQPNPVVQGNNIYGNTSWNLYTTSYVNGATTKLNFQQNWWGWITPATIGYWIYDYTDSQSGSYPVVDYSNYLNGLNGQPVPGNYLSGTLTSSTTLTGGTTYDVLGTLAVANGQTLTLPAGTVLRFYETNAQLLVNGTLNIQGTSASPVTITSGNTSPARGSWVGIVLNGSVANGSTINNALVEWASTGVDVNGATGVTVANSTIRNFSSYGIYVRNGGNATISSNLITNVSGATGTGVYVYGTSPTLTGNTVTYCSYGLSLYGAANPTINRANTLSNNNYGLYLQGAGNATTQPNPVVNGNNIYANNSYNAYATSYVNGAVTKLNFQQNWWGWAAPATIGYWIYDYTDSQSGSYPVIDYSSYLNGLNGQPVAGNYLSGTVTSSTTLVGGTTYDVLGTLAVASGQTLTIPAGAVLHFYETNAQLLVNGTLNVQGTAASPVTITSGNTTPARGAWVGIVFNGSTANGSSIANALVEWATTGVDINAATGVTVSNSTIRNFSSYGFNVRNGGNAAIAGNVITNVSGATGTGIYVYGTSPTLTGNTISYCYYGVSLYGAASPTITQANTLTNNSYGVYVQGAGSATTQPTPVVNGNNIYGNTYYNAYTTSYVNGAATKLNFQQNWWGSASPVVIGASIYDYTDSQSGSYPVVDYSSYLNGLNGQPVPGNYLTGSLSSSTSLTSGTTYDLLGTVTVPSGQTLTVPAGATLRMYESNAQLLVNGTLSIQGTAASPVTITSGAANPARGAWTGIVLNGNAANGSSISYALVEWATTAVDVNGATGVTVSNSTLRNFSSYGMNLRNGGNATIAGNLITNLSGATGTGVYANAASPSLTGNTISYCYYGVMAYGAANPSITQQNTVTNNNYGVYVQGAGSATTQPNPVVNGNNIYANNNYNVYTTSYVNGATTKLNFQQNWWGSTSPTTIGGTIYDYTVNMSASYPVVDYSNFLDGLNGNPVPGNYLIGSLTASVALNSGTTYDVLGDLIVPSGTTLTVPSGVVLRFSRPYTRLLVDGSLSIQGTSSARVTLTSSLNDPVKGSWYGIEVHPTATNVVINYAVVDWANIAINVTGANVTISNSWIRNFGSTGIQMTNTTSASQISGNYIDNYSQSGYAIYLSAASPSISGNQIYGSAYGIYLVGASNPSITGNALSRNLYGIYLNGNSSSSATAVPNPVITGNDLFGNSYAQLLVSSYGASNPVVINATGNWWGTASPQSGQQIQFNGGSPTSSVNFSSPASGALTGPVSGNLTVSQAYFSPNGDGIQDTTAISAVLSQSASWTINIRDGSGTAIRSYSGTGTNASATWDGKNGSGQVVADGIYAIELAVPSSANPLGTGRVTLDNTAPQTVVSSPAASAVLTNSLTVPVTGTATDAYFVSYTLEYGAGSSPTTWTTIATQTAPVMQNTLGNWVVNTTNGTVALPNGPYVVRLRASDKAGNASATTVSVSLNNLSITGVTQSTQVLQPLSGTPLQVNFTLGAAATTYLRIYSEKTGALVREISQTFTSGGAQTFSWDGKDASGAYLPDEVYDYVIYTTDGSRTATYDIPAPTPNGANSGTAPASFNAYRNIFWKMTDYTTTGGRVRGQISGCVPTAFNPFSNITLPSGTWTLMWDGRDANGQLASGSCSFYFDVPLTLKPNSVIIKGNAPVITGTGAAPNVEVQSTPWMITHSYEHISKIIYRVSQDSYVTVKLLPPGISDPASSQAIVLVNNELEAALNGSQPADHTVEWRGYDTTHTNSILVSAEGAYTFAIQATSVQSGQQSLYRGVLQLYQ